MNLAVFVGPRGRGSNLSALCTAISEGRLSARIVLVLGTKPDAPALLRAAEIGLPTLVVDPRGDATEYGERLLGALAAAGADTIALAGYLRRLPSSVVGAFPHRIVNIHPSLLPAFGGQGMYGEHVHRAVLEYGAKVSGCTVHFVDESYDTGPIILQRAVPVEENDTPETLAARILPAEHRLFAEALQLLAAGRLRVEGRIVRIYQGDDPA
ncbi:MAG: phosphoribosylglycinamide formyltransferase [Capsulimonadales bacterium]|nr:phosphoribosylglycinamide formyltransferase [Capsulimonadales bacterium]